MQLIGSTDFLNYTRRQRTSRQYKLQKRRQLFIRTHAERFSATMCINAFTDCSAPFAAQIAGNDCRAEAPAIFVLDIWTRSYQIS